MDFFKKKSIDILNSCRFRAKNNNINMRLDNFTKNNIIMFIGTSIGSFFSLLYQLVMVRLVSKDTFASLNSLLSLLAIISVPYVAFTIMVTKHISCNDARKKDELLKAIWRKLFIHAFFFSSAVFVLIIFLSSSLVNFLHLESLNSIIILAAIFFLSGIITVVTGGLQGLERFSSLSVIIVTAGFTRLLFSVILVKRFPDSLEAALLGALSSVCVSVFLGIWPLRFLFRGKSNQRVDLKPLYVYIFPTFLVLLSFAMLTNIDMVLVKHFFLKEAHIYSIAQLIGKIILFIPGTIYIVMFSRVCRLYAVNENSTKILKRSLLFTTILSLLVVIVYNLYPRLLFGILVGPLQEQPIMLARVLSLVMFFYALSNILFYYQLSIESYSFIKSLVLVAILQIILISSFHKTLLSVAFSMLFSSFLIFILNFKSAFSQRGLRQD